MGKLKQVVVWGGTIIALGVAALAVLPGLYRERAPRPAVLATDTLAKDTLEPAEVAALPWCVDEADPDSALPPPDAVVYLQFNLPLLYLRQLPDNAGDATPPPPPETEEPPVGVTIRTSI